MKTPIKYLIFLLLSVLTSCWERELPDIIPEIYKPELNNNDTLFFRDSLNNKVDTFLIDLSYLQLDSDGYNYSEHLRMNYNMLNKHITIKRFWISQGSKAVTVSLDKYYYDRIEYTVVQSNLTKHNMFVRGVLYPDTYDLKQYHFETDTLPKTVYYTLKHGIIRYDYADGRKYELINK